MIAPSGLEIISACNSDVINYATRPLGSGNGVASVVCNVRVSIIRNSHYRKMSDPYERISVPLLIFRYLLPVFCQPFYVAASITSAFWQDQRGLGGNGKTSV